jgi:GNAT superfamily N-acetyltransferase
VLLLFYDGRCCAMAKAKTCELNMAVANQENGSALEQREAEESQSVGIIAWLMVEPAMQRRGFAAPLIEALLAELEQQGCVDTVACIHCCNTASARGCAALGFHPMAMGQQLSRYGAQTLKLWHEAYHLSDVGHLLWRKGPASRARDEGPWLNMLLQLIPLCLLTWTWYGESFSGGTLKACAVIVVSASLRYHCLRWSGRQLKAWHHRAWESSHLPLGVISLATGVWWPNLGLHTCADPRVPNAKVLRAQSRGMLACSFFGLLTLWSLQLLFPVWSPDYCSLTANAMVLEHLLCFFPFQGWAGARLWQRGAWVHVLSFVPWLLTAWIFF